VAVSLKRPKEQLALFRYPAEEIQTTAAIGAQDDQAESFDERAPDGGILVGAHVITGESWGGAVSAIEPIFQVGGEYKRQGPHGTAEGESHVLVAPAGHAVGGLQVRAGAVMDAIRLVYMPVKGKQLDTEKVEYSEWVGGEGGREQEVVGDGSIVVGLGGTFREKEMHEVRLHFVDRQSVRTAVPRRQAAGNKQAEELRTWKSASGKFSVEAKIESFDGKEAVLVSKAGKKIKVASEKLSAGDRAYLESWQKRQAESPAEPAEEEVSPFE
jgi:hypothetical protein